MDRLLRSVAIQIVRTYQLTLSPWLGGACRFYPSCSRYALDAFSVHSFGQATRLVTSRLCRCHPWGGEGFDPVPPLQKRLCHE